MCLLLVCKRYLRCIGSSGRILPSAGKDGRCDGRPRPMRAAPCSASLCVCLHHHSVTCSFQTASHYVRSIGSSRAVVPSAGWQGDGGGGLSWHQPSACAGWHMRYAFPYAFLCLPMRSPAPPRSSVQRPASHCMRSLTIRVPCCWASERDLRAAGMEARPPANHLRLPPTHPMC